MGAHGNTKWCEPVLGQREKLCYAFRPRRNQIDNGNRALSARMNPARIDYRLLLLLGKPHNRLTLIRWGGGHAKAFALRLRHLSQMRFRSAIAESRIAASSLRRPISPWVKYCFQSLMLCLAKLHQDNLRLICLGMRPNSDRRYSTSVGSVCLLQASEYDV